MCEQCDQQAESVRVFTRRTFLALGAAVALGVTDETVRKDFEALEERGELVRVHGGATRPERPREELTLTERQRIRREEKHAIARLAASRIRPNQWVRVFRVNMPATMARISVRCWMRPAWPRPTSSGCPWAE